MNKQRIQTGILTIAIGLTLIAASYAAWTHTTIHTTGIISNLGVYSDIECTSPTNWIDWGTPAPDSIVERTVYLKNLGGFSITLNLTTSNWNPTNANNHMQITWDREYYNLASQSAIECTFTLTVFENVTSSDPKIGAFSSDIIITGTSA